MRLERDGADLVLRLAAGERRLLVWALERATFEDTPPERQREILDFAAHLLTELRETAEG